ncbi:hypothetical protein GQ457_07G038010 [Hibiscus cannabinus]
MSFQKLSQVQTCPPKGINDEDLELHAGQEIGDFNPAFSNSLHSSQEDFAENGKLDICASLWRLFVLSCKTRQAGDFKFSHRGLSWVQGGDFKLSSFLLFLKILTSWLKMDIGFFGSVLILSLLFKHFTCQLPNTDEFYVSGFLKKMGSNSSLSYNFSGSVCSWEEVHCDTKKENVIGLKASGLGLSGLMPDTTIGKLTQLQYLDLSNNEITALPSDLWSLSSLKDLISPLIRFLAISSLVSLQVLKISGNGFERSIPTGILNCQSLVSLDLSLNRLNGSLPDGFGAAFPKLKSLNLAKNEIFGHVSDFAGLKSLISLNISGNLFKGWVTSVFQGQLQVIDLSKNHLQGYISQVQFDSAYKWSRLVYLDLSENQLNGEIFQNLSQADNLRHLNLAYNRFARQKFPRIEKLLGLEYLNLSKSSLIGHIPGEILQMSNLHALDVSSNYLTGHIPSLAHKSLKILDVSHNNLSGEIPISLLEKLAGMERYNFSYNNLTLCDPGLSLETLETSFYGSLNSCPIAANPVLIKRRANRHRGYVLALALTLSMVCWLAVPVLRLPKEFQGMDS